MMKQTELIKREKCVIAHQCPEFTANVMGKIRKQNLCGTKLKCVLPIDLYSR